MQRGELRRGALQVEFEQAAQDFVVVVEDVVRPAVSVTHGAVEGGVEFEQARGEGGGIRLDLDGFHAFEDVEGVIQIGEGAVFNTPVPISILPSPSPSPLRGSVSDSFNGKG